MALPSLRELLRRTGIALLVALAGGSLLYVGLVTRLYRLGGLSRGDWVPWYTQADPRGSLWTLVGVGVVVAAVAAAPGVVRARSNTRALLRLLPLALLVWVGVALSDGAKTGERRSGLVPANGISYPFERTAHEYIGDVPKVDRYGVRGLLRAWPTAEVQNTLAWHSRTHPPGAVLLLAAIDPIGWGGATASGLAVLLLGALGLLPALAFARLHLGEVAARWATLLFALAPNTVLFFATSMETVFTALAVTALWAMSAAIRVRSVGASIAANAAAGAALALSTFFTYASILVVLTVAAFEGVRLARSGAARATTPEWSGTIGRLALQLAGFVAFVLALKALGWDAIASVRVALAADAQVMGTGGGFVEWLAVGGANLLAWGIGLGLATLAIGGWVLDPDRKGEASRAAERIPDATSASTAERVPDAALAAAVVPLVAAFSTLFTLEVERIWIVLNLPALVGILALVEAARSRGPSQLEAERGGSSEVRSRDALLRGWVALLLVQTLLIEILGETRW